MGKIIKIVFEFNEDIDFQIEKYVKLTKEQKELFKTRFNIKLPKYFDYKRINGIENKVIKKVKQSGLI